MKKIMLLFIIFSAHLFAGELEQVQSILNSRFSPEQVGSISVGDLFPMSRLIRKNAYQLSGVLLEENCNIGVADEVIIHKLSASRDRALVRFIPRRLNRRNLCPQNSIIIFELESLWRHKEIYLDLIQRMAPIRPAHWITQAGYSIVHEVNGYRDGDLVATTMLLGENDPVDFKSRCEVKRHGQFKIRGFSMDSTMVLLEYDTVDNLMDGECDPGNQFYISVDLLP